MEGGTDWESSECQTRFYSDLLDFLENVQYLTGFFVAIKSINPVAIFT